MLAGLLCPRCQSRWTRAAPARVARGRASARCTPRKTVANGDYSLSEDDKDEHEEYPGGGLAKFYHFRTGFVKLFRKRIAASGIASDYIFKKTDAVWAKVKDMEEAEECEYDEKRAAVQSARICAWKIKDHISRLRLDVKEKLEDAVCALTRTGWKRSRLWTSQGLKC